MSEDKKNKTSDSGTSSIIRYIVGFALCLSILGASSAIAIHFWFNQTDTERRTPPTKIPLVDGITLKPTDFVIELPSQGRVQARAISRIKTEVTGRILSIEPPYNEGGFLKQGQKL